jgi:NAD-dependent deacetylase
MRCAADCTAERWPIPDAVPELAKGAALTAETRALLACPRCDGLARPHVLWFDESYDEPRYYFDTARQLAAAAALLVIVGTSASTTLPWQIVTLASRAGATIVDINVEDNPFGEIAATSGGVIRAPATSTLPRLIDAIVERGSGHPRSD